MGIGKDQRVLEYSTPPRKLPPPLVGKLTASSIILPLVYRLITGVMHIEPGYRPLTVDEWPFVVNWSSEFLVVSGIYFLFAAIAVLALWRHKPPLATANCLTALVGLGLNILIGVGHFNWMCQVNDLYLVHH